MKSLTRSEINAIVSVSGLQMRAMVLTSFAHGLRSSECTGLLRSDVNLEARTIYIRSLKGSNWRLEPILDIEMDSLALWLSVAPASRYAFVMPNGRPINRMTWYRWFREAAELAGIDKARRHSHVLRHALGYALVEANVSLPIIQTALRHKSLSSTAVYARPSEQAVNKAVLGVLGTGG